MSSPASDPADLETLQELIERFDVASALGARVDRLLFASGNLSRVYGIETSAGERVVLKVRADSVRLDAVARVQSLLHRAGQPLPEPLAGPWRRDGVAISAERLVPGGSARGPAGDAARDFAEVFFALLTAAPPGEDFPELREDAPPWVNWSHTEDTVWPARDTPGAEIRGPGPDDVDDAGRAAAEVLRGLDRPRVIAHADFEDQNVRWRDGRIHVVHDWDSLALLPECAAVGSTAAAWPAGVVQWCATVEQSEDFLTAYELVRGRPFDDAERRAAWAAALWHRSFNARKDAADGGGMQLDLFRRDARRLRALAGVG